MAVSKKYKKGRPYRSQKSSPLPQLIHKKERKNTVFFRMLKLKKQIPLRQNGETEIVYRLWLKDCRKRKRFMNIVASPPQLCIQFPKTLDTLQMAVCEEIRNPARLFLKV